MKKLLTFAFIILFGQLNYCQPEPITIQFVEAQPLWEHIIWDTNYYDVGIQPGLNKYTTVHPHQCYRYNNDIIIASQCFNFNAETYGYILEKLNIQSGQIAWQKYHTYYNGGFQDHYKNLFLRPDGNLEMVGIKLHGPYMDSLFGYWNIGGGQSNFIRKVFDYELGELIHSVIGHDSVEDFIPQYVHFYPVEFDSIYLALNLSLDNLDDTVEYGYYIYQLDHNHNLAGGNPNSIVEYETTDSLSPLSFGQPQFTQKLDDSTFVGLVFQDKLFPDKTRAQLIWFVIKDVSNVKVIKRLNIEDLIPGQETRFLYMTFDYHDNRIYLAQPYRDSILNYAYTSYLIILDRSGNLLHHIPRMTDTDHIYGSVRLVYTSSDFDYFAGFPSKTGRKGFDVRKLTRESNSFQYISSLTSANEDEEFTRELAVSKLYDDGLFVMGAYTKKLGPIQNAAVKYYCFNGADLGMQLATSNQNIVQNEKIKVFPNPTSASTALLFEQAFSGTVQLFDSEGNLVRSYQMINEVTFQISLQDLPSGAYYATITDSNTKQKSTVKIMKISGS